MAATAPDHRDSYQEDTWPAATRGVSWAGGLDDGKGRTSLDSSGVAVFDVSFPSRLADSPQQGQTDPKELIAAAHATASP